MFICMIYFVGLLFLSIIMFISSMNFMILDYSMMLEIEMMSINSCMIIMTILLDWMSLLFMSFVLFISSMVIFYSAEYMYGDYSLDRFILLVIMFVLSMMLLIISPNLVSILLGWDGLGLVSYCLVVYYQNSKSYNAGMITALTNRVGDVALLMAIAWMMNYGGWNYYYYVECMKESDVMNIISYLVVLAAMTKSAQIPFSSWLPAAMAAPTPVSSLVHSSTLVTAGVYLAIRFNFSFSDKLMMFLLFISSLTMFMAGLGASFENDLKKIIALSTLSQLGLMLSILSLGSFDLAFYHLLTHALFKALLFMCAGCMIHNLGNCQDIRYMGGLINFMPLTCCFFIICNMALCGLPFLSGFYSKDLILEVLSMEYINIYIYMIYFISTGLTVCYTFRLIYYVITGDFNYSSLHMISDKGFIMLGGMSGLITLVIFGGSMLMWMMFPVPYYINLPIIMKTLALTMTVLGGWIGYEMSHFYLGYSMSSMNYFNLSVFLGSMWNMPFISTFGINYYFLNVGDLLYKSMDQGWSEYYGSQNIYKKLSEGSLFLQVLYLNNIKIFLFMLVAWLIFLFIFL
uniref:NADH-ubiquinone oxidoreductase chain 5 n=1 Tax=Sinodendron cylindricum TaxID=618634 RepID=A0A7L7S690_9SCAR|nr:NADH dehydrogenase subunit 5 [Sinodendron cylindricum]